MKIQTQFHLMIAGILAVPILLILTQFIYMNMGSNRKEIALYEDIVATLDNGTDFENRERLPHFLYSMSRFGDITIFSMDFSVIHSTIPRFSPGETYSMEAVIETISRHDGRYAYSFESPHMTGNSIYILVRRDTIPLQGKQFDPLFYPILIVMGLFLFLVIFAITVSLLIASSITRSILVLESATRRITAGDLDLAIEVKGNNEITSLTNSLNTMRKALKENEMRRYRFIMGVTHDLKTPLALIKLYTEAITDGITEDPATHISATEIINAKVDQLEGMISDLIEWVRMDTGEWRGQLRNINFSAFLRQSAKAFTLDAELLRHEFRFNSMLPDTISIPMDERLVYRALENIVNNAIRYTPDGSIISINAGIADNTIRLAVSDNGPGIAEADLPHIFDMFYRGTSSRREQGMGLGLAVAKWVADCHGWEITAASEEGCGVCFTFVIPVTHGVDNCL
jgi:signal transduction histidine kinase